MSKHSMQSTKAAIALNKFNEYHCAQSVVYAFSEDVNIDKDTLLALSTGFGAGFGRKQEVCGAVSGAVMILGAKYGRKDNEPKDKTEKAYSEVQKFIDEFTQIKGSIVCAELLSGCNLLTEEGQELFKKEKRREVCEGCVELACKILQKHFRQSERYDL